MKAIQMTETGGPEVLQLAEIPDPTPAPGEILIRVESAAVNFADVVRRRGDPFDLPSPLPFTPGIEVAGTVVALGEGVEGPPVGSTVFATAGPYANGGYAELAVAQQANVIPAPEGMDPDVAASLLAVGLTATLMLTEVGHVGTSSTVFIPAAAGGLGSYAVQIAKALGAATIIAGASTPQKRQIALDSGAHHAVDYRGGAWTEDVLELTDGRGVDLALEMTGPEHLGQTARILAPFGRMIVFGAVAGRAGKVNGADLDEVFYAPALGQAIFGFNLTSWFEHRLAPTIGALQRLIGWIADGTIAGPPIQAFPLAEAAETHRLLETGESTGKLVLKP
ncbi:quinone oxidoreductase family protein [Candidatus Solirubrobacter pratensis]|uniref:quinone oxidoreductase family protein n=1 Tax=Candidatus Solirubrobacter pratensis TaxID=1298857 RepID=UPI00040C1056|nr:zinc-binding dehydrogenase [Candidatus Solirubrobacter pratensis]